MKFLPLIAISLLLPSCATTAIHWRTASGGNASALVLGSGVDIEATEGRLSIRHPKSGVLEELGGLALRIAPFFL